MIMFSSDVSARGMDYPDVTAVIQVGMASDKAQYIHRIGRTARAGKSGGGFLLLADYESPFLQMLSGVPLSRRSPLSTAAAAPLTAEFNQAMGGMEHDALGQSYQASHRWVTVAWQNCHMPVTSEHDALGQSYQVRQERRVSNAVTAKRVPRAHRFA